VFAPVSVANEFSRFDTVDVGGGTGPLLTTILQPFPVEKSRIMLSHATAPSHNGKEPQMDDGRAVLSRLHQAMNAHDIDAFVDCFAPDYQSEQPVYPNRRFMGNAQVRKNWSSIFESIPDFRANLLRSAVEADTVWSEWHWTGTQADGTPLEMAGVIIMGVSDGRISWGRLHVDYVESDSAAIDEAMKQMTGERN
jgi:ketosteroid isomerase-like protein